MWLLCSFQGPSERATRAYAGTVAGDGRRGLSKLNSMRGLELGGMPRDAEASRPLAEARRQLARPGSVDMLGRTVGGQPCLIARDRSGERGGRRRAVRAPFWCSLERR